MQMITKTIIITGSHHTPAIELINQLKNDSYHWQINYIGDVFKSETHLTNTIIPDHEINFYQLTSGKFHRRWLPDTIRGIPKTLAALISSFKLVSTIKPDIIISFGGYVSVPIIIAGSLLKIPTITHEQTLTNSLSTKINSLFATKVALSFEEPNQIKQLPSKKVVVTGNLLRSDIFKIASSKYRHLESTIKKYPLIYITGGAQGSSAINQTITKIIPSLSAKYTIIHHCGKLEYDLIKSQLTSMSHYIPTDYVGLDDIGWVLHNADIVISRSGVNTCQEIVALHKKSILIPLPFSQQNEQLLNAQWVKKWLPKTTIIIDQNQLSANTLLESIDQLAKTKSIHPPKTAIANNLVLKLIHELI